MCERRGWQAVGLLMVLLSAFHTSTSGADILAKLYSEAQAAEQKGDYAIAIDRYRKILELVPDMAEAHARLGGIYFSTGQKEKAETAFKNAIRLNPRLWGPQFSLGVIAFQRRQYDAALEALRKAERLDPNSVPTQLYLGYTQYARSHFIEAAGHSERAAAGDHPNTDAIYHLSKSYGRAAKRFFELLQERFHDSAYAALARAHIYEIKNDWQEAQREYGSALKQMPDNLQLRQKFESISFRTAADEGALAKGNAPDELVDGFLKFQFAAPSGRDIVKELHRYRGQVEGMRKSLDKTREAKDLYRLEESCQSLSFLASLWLFDIEPDSYRAHQLKGQYYETLKKEAEAITEYRHALELNPQLQNVHLSIATIYWTKGYLDDALQEVRQELELNPDDPSALYIAGDILSAQNHMEQAKVYFLRSLKLAPRMVEAHLGAARIYTSEEEYRKALDELQQVLRLEPENTMAHYRLAQIYQKQGKLEESKKEMEIFERLKDTHPRQY